MTLLPFSSAESTAASPKLVASLDASLEALRAELLTLPLPDAAGENCPESYERAVSAALNRMGCALLGAAVEELDERRDRLVLDGRGVLLRREVFGGADEFLRPGAL